MRLEIKNKNNKNKIKLFVVAFFVLLQINFVHTALSATMKAQEMIDLMNESRIEAGLSPLIINGELSRAAMAKANDMFANQYFDHNSPSGKTPWNFIKSAGYEYQFAGENLAIDFITAKAAHKALMESSSHRANILNTRYTEIGVAVIEGHFEGNNSIIIVEEFGVPLQKKEVINVNMQELEIEIEQRMNEINTEAVKTNIQKVKSEKSIQSKIEEGLDKNSIVSGEEIYLNEEKITLAEGSFNGVCEAENVIYVEQGFINENNYINNKIQTESKALKRHSNYLRRFCYHRKLECL